MSHRILLVDDDKAFCSLLTNFLSKRGHEVHCFASGKVGLMAALSGNYHIVLIDSSPQEIPIDEFLVEVRQTRPDPELPVIVLRNRDGWAFTKKCLDAGATGVFPRPLTLGHLILNIEKCLRSVYASAY